MQPVPIKPTLIAPGSKRLNLNVIICFQSCFNFPFKFNWRRYNLGTTSCIRIAPAPDLNVTALAAAGTTAINTTQLMLNSTTGEILPGQGLTLVLFR